MLKMPRRRLSSDGLKLFNLATAPSPSKVRQLLSCLFHSEYDDRLAEMTSSCKQASKQLFSLHGDRTKRQMITTSIDNSIFNVINAILCKDGDFATRFQIRQNYRYFMDVLDQAHRDGDHNTAIMLRAALQHHALKQLKLKERKKDKDLLARLESEYGTWRDCYKEHLKTIMQSDDLDILPSMMVLRMHVERHRAYSTVGGCKLRYEPALIEGKIGMYAILHQQYDDLMPLYQPPPISTSSDLIMLAQRAL